MMHFPHRLLFTGTLMAGLTCQTEILAATYGYESRQTDLAGIEGQIAETEKRIGKLEADLSSMRLEMKRLENLMDGKPRSSGSNAGQQSVSFQQSNYSAPPSGQSSESGRVHVVQRGETLSNISRQYRVGIDRIVAANRISNPHALRIGQEIFIPGGNSGSGKPAPSSPSSPSLSNSAADQKMGVHVISPGETFYSVSVKYGTSVEEIVQNNPGVNANALQVGTRLRVPGAGSTSSTSSPPARSGGGNVGSANADKGDVIEAPPGHGFYQIQKGDNLQDIANDFGTTTTKLRSLNKLDSNAIKVGEYLLVPVNDPAVFTD